MLLYIVPMTAYSASTDSLKSTILSVAHGEVGYQGTRQYSKYGEWYGYQGGWCTTFAIWCYHTAGDKLGTELYGKMCPLGGNCNSMISWFSNKGWYHTRGSGYTPQKGDFIFLDWSGNGSAQHVGIVDYVSGGVIHTVEGNCGAKVKERQYSQGGNKPYSNVSAILGYGSPNWSAVASAPLKAKKQTSATKKKQTTSAKKTTAKTTAKPTTTAKPKTTEKAKQSTAASSTKKTTTQTTKATTKVTTTTTTTAPPVVAKDMTIHAATNELEVGDSVKLDYTVKPNGANAVVGYFCDDENIIEISGGGVITATGEGTATVVVCANDEIYRQCDFVVTKAKAEVTVQTPVDSAENTTLGKVKKTAKQKLSEIGINSDKIISHKNDYIIPVCIIGATAFLSLAILAVKAAAQGIRKRREEKTETSD